MPKAYFLIKGKRLTTFYIAEKVCGRPHIISAPSHINMSGIKEANVVLAGNVGDTVVIPNHVTSIGKYAFENSKMTKVIIPPSVTEISPFAFCNCHNLRTVMWGQNCKKVPLGCFAGSENLVSVKRLDNVTSVAENAFNGCSSLTCVEFKNVTSIGMAAFKYCESLETISGLSNVISVGKQCFVDCKSLESVEFSILRRLQEYAFSGCEKLRNISGLNNTVHIGNSAFADCKSLETFTWPETCDIIPYLCFNGCRSLTSINIGANVSMVKNQAFQRTGLTELDLSSTKVAYIPANLAKHSRDLVAVKLPYYITNINRNALKGTTATFQ